MEFRDRKVGRRMGYLIPKDKIVGEAKDIETIVRLRPWIEDIWKEKHGSFTKTKLKTDYDAEIDLFRFEIIFNI